MSLVLIGYLLKKLLIRFGLLTGLLALIYCVIDYVETVSNTVSTAGLVSVYSVYGYRIPEILTHMLPLSLSASVLLTVTDCKKRGEWHAIQMAGISERHMQSVLLLVPLLLLPLTHVTVHQWAPRAVAVFESAVNHRRVSPVTRYREKDWLVSRSSVTQRGIRVRRLSSGRASELLVVDDGNARQHVWRAGAEKAPSSVTVPRSGSDAGLLIPEYGTNGIFASSISTDSLRQMAVSLKQRGAPVARIQSTIALRSSIVWASLVVPFVALLLLISMSGVSSGFSAIALSVGVSGMYWSVLMLLWAWGTAAAGRMSLIPGLCVLMVLMGGLAGARWIRIHHR